VAAERDRDALASLRGPEPAGPTAEISVVPNGVDFDEFRADGQPRDGATLLFLGRLSYHANVRAACHLVEDIMPRVWAERPDVRVVLAGAEPARRVRTLGRRYRPRVDVTGYVPDVRPWLARATVSVNPLLYAVGVQNKVLEAMAMGAPVVATSEACGGLRIEDGKELLVADGPDAFARRILEVLGDPDRRRRLAAHGRAYVEAHHDWRESGARLEEIYWAEMRRVATDRPNRRAGAASS
jgi:glycosyltransferase involved in cell wall biosynthesis